MSPSDFMHPEDASALRQLESIPGFPSFIKSILSLGQESLHLSYPQKSERMCRNM